MQRSQAPYCTRIAISLVPDAVNVPSGARTSRPRLRPMLIHSWPAACKPAWQRSNVSMSSVATSDAGELAVENGVGRAAFALPGRLPHADDGDQSRAGGCLRLGANDRVSLAVDGPPLGMADDDQASA